MTRARAKIISGFVLNNPFVMIILLSEIINFVSFFSFFARKRSFPAEVHLYRGFYDFPEPPQQTGCLFKSRVITTN